MKVVTGDQAPDFTLPNEDNQLIHLYEILKNQWVVIFFYPKDKTSGCTKEACAFRDLNAKFESLGVRLLGVSRDSSQSHQRFIEDYDLNMTLLVDADAKVADAYGIWVERSMYGRKYMGIERSTFLISPDGLIRQAWRQVKVANHADVVFAQAQKLIQVQ